MGMTFASIAALRNGQGMLARWREKILSHTYDPRPIYAAGKRGATVGMAMTEKQGGSDLPPPSRQRIRRPRDRAQARNTS